MSLLRLQEVSCHYGAVHAVDRVGFDVERGEFVTLLGPSGCGKTTTLRMVAGLERNTHGVITIMDREVSNARTGKFLEPEKRQLGMVFQSYAIWPHMSVFENVAYPLRIRRLPKSEIRQRVKKALELVEMQNLAERDAPALSGGQQQRVAIARALVFEPEVLLLDEPLSNLDAKLRAQMGDEFRALQQRLGITTIYVTHDQDEAMALSDRIAVMQDGRLLQIATPEVIYHRPETADVAEFVGAPNFIRARAEKVTQADDLFRVRFATSGIAGSCLARDPIRAGDEIVVMIRPESLQMRSPEEEDQPDLVVNGTVEQTIFRGARRSARLCAKGMNLSFDAPSFVRFEQGDAVVLTVPQGTAWAMRASASQRGGGSAPLELAAQ